MKKEDETMNENIYIKNGWISGTKIYYQNKEPVSSIRVRAVDQFVEIEEQYYQDHPDYHFEGSLKLTLSIYSSKIKDEYLNQIDRRKSLSDFPSEPDDPWQIIGYDMGMGSTAGFAGLINCYAKLYISL